jgi:diguanylate cyclase (GGDEF)-like protein
MVILLAIMAVHAYYKLDRKEQVYKTFFVLILLTLLILVLEILSVTLNSSNNIDLILAHKLIDTAGFTLSPLVPISAVLYVYRKTNKSKKINKSRLYWLGVPLVANSVLSLGSCNYNWLFGITSENLYMRGPLFIVSPLTSYFYYLIYLCILYNSRKKLYKEELLILGLLTLIPAIMSIFQLYYFIYLTIWNSMAIAVVMNYIFIIHSQTKLDPLTGLGNRVAYNEYLASLPKKNNIVLAVLTIDLDDFKGINDSWGHQEGDKVLKVFARQLKDVFDEVGLCIRLGGDEFIVLIHENQKEVVDKYLKTLIDKVAAYNESNDMLHINFSYGMTIFNNAYNDLQELIHHSDKLMYEEKQKKELLGNNVL